MKVFRAGGVLLACALSACATTTPTNQTNNQDAKQTLASAVKSQLYSSFGYQTDIYISNALREQQLASAIKEQSQSVEDKMQTCEEIHDQQYIALRGQSFATNQDFLDLKQSYLTCIKDRDWATGDEFDIFSLMENTQDLSDDELLDRLLQSYSEYKSEKVGQVQNHLPEHESNPTALDVKKSQLLKAYLIEPSQLSIVGKYQPLAGKLTALPATHYQAKNLSAYLNQPVHFDFKKGVLYLWADNLAMLLGSQLDPKLGDQWKNKWLALPINDGSLPANFSEDLIKAVMHAQKESFESLDKSVFRWVTPDDVLKLPYLTDHLSEQNQNLIKNNLSIIQKNATESQQAFARYIFAESLLSDILNKYPELNLTNKSLSMQLRGNESLIEIVGLTSQVQHTDGLENKQLAVNSRLFANFLVLYLHALASDYQQKSLDFLDKEGAYQQLSHYGIQGSQINWIHQRKYSSIPINMQDLQDLSTPLIIDTFTTLTQQLPNFDKLPSNAQEPNSQNTVNLFDYTNHLFKKAQTGDYPLLSFLLKDLLGLDDGGQLQDGDFLDAAPVDSDEPMPEELPLP